jgi:hypothetical protein
LSRGRRRQGFRAKQSNRDEHTNGADYPVVNSKGDHYDRHHNYSADKFNRDEHTHGHDHPVFKPKGDKLAHLNDYSVLQSKGDEHSGADYSVRSDVNEHTYGVD